MDASDRLNEIGARMNAATPGPWRVEETSHIACLLERGEECLHPDSPLLDSELMADIKGAPTRVYHTHEARETPHRIEPDIAGNYDWEEGGIVHGDDAEFIAHARTDVPALVAALRAVLDMHARRPWRLGDFLCHGQTEFPDQCDACRTEWPCPTVLAVEAALGGFSMPRKDPEVTRRTKRRFARELYPDRGNDQ